MICSADPKRKLLQFLLCLALIGWAAGMTPQECDEYDHACEVSREANHGEPVPPYSPPPQWPVKTVNAATTSLSALESLSFHIGWTPTAT
jgi:hypothetical protein